MKHVFYHITDTHYYSKKNFALDPWSYPQFDDQMSFRESEEIIKKALQIILEDEETSTVIMTGDMTNHGETYSHEEMTALLRDFEAKGGKPYAVTDSHDYPWFDIFRIDEKGNRVPKEHMPREDVVPMYYPFGRDKASDTFDGDDTTYIAEILPGLRYIAMGYELTSEDGLTDPAFSDEQMAWVKKHADEAKEDGAIIICGTHWPIVTPSPAYNILGKGNTFVNGEERAKELADMGIRLFFSGHTHIQYMGEITSDKGNKLYSVQTSALTGFPPKMRRITIDTDTGLVQIRTIDLDLPELNLGMSLTEYCRKGFLGSIEMIPYNMEHDIKAFAETGGGITLPKELIYKHPKIVSFIGKKINGLTCGTMAAFSKKYHGMKKSEYAHKKDDKVVPFLLDLVAHLYSGNANVEPESVEYKVTMAVVKKIEKLTKTFGIKLDKLLCGYTLSEVVDPLLYNSGLDDDNVDVMI